MSVSRYIDIDSTYRDRITYPKVGNFALPVNTEIKNSPLTAYDPVLLSFPYETDRTSGLSTTTAIVLSTQSSSIVNFYVGDTINIGADFSVVTAYNATTNIATISPAFSVAPPNLTPYYIRKQNPTYFPSGASQDTLLVDTPTLSTVVLGALASSTTDFYVNQYIFFPVIGIVVPNPALYVWALIIAYNGTTKTATLSAPLSYIIQAVVAGIPTVYQILPFSYDNARPLSYNGTSIFNNPSCKQVKLINLIVPNANIKGGYGGTLQNYPYVYVSLYSDKGNTWNNPIEGNNPTAKKALFKVPVSFLANSSWLTLQGSYMSHSIPFRENDTLHLTVYLPNGEILDFLPNNQYSYFENYKFPVFSVPSNQIQAVFEVVNK